MDKESGMTRKMKTLCRIRDINRAVSTFETEMIKKHHLCLNEGMLLCTLSKEEQLTSGEIADTLGLTASNASKVIKSVEDKALVKRVIGDVDKRQMYFSLTSSGREALAKIDCGNIELPDLLKEIMPEAEG